jgi:hypothetical protein
VPAAAWPLNPARTMQEGRPGRPSTVALAVRLRTSSLLDNKMQGAGRRQEARGRAGISMRAGAHWAPAELGPSANSG